MPSYLLFIFINALFNLYLSLSLLVITTRFKYDSSNLSSKELSERLRIEVIENSKVNVPSKYHFEDGKLFVNSKALLDEGKIWLAFDLSLVRQGTKEIDFYSKYYNKDFCIIENQVQNNTGKPFFLD